MGTADLLRAGRRWGPSRGRRLDYSHTTERHRATGGEGRPRLSECWGPATADSRCPRNARRVQPGKEPTWEADGRPQALGHRQTPKQQGRAEQSRLTNANHGSLPCRSPAAGQKPRLGQKQRGG